MPPLGRLREERGRVRLLDHPSGVLRPEGASLDRPLCCCRVGRHVRRLVRVKGAELVGGEWGTPAEEGAISAI